MVQTFENKARAYTKGSQLTQSRYPAEKIVMLKHASLTQIMATKAKHHFVHRVTSQCWDKAERKFKNCPQEYEVNWFRNIIFCKKTDL